MPEKVVKSGPASIVKYRRIEDIRFLTESTFVVRFTRGDFEFIPGQHVIAGIKGSLDQREYSIYSGSDQDYLEILVKAVTDGSVSLQLKESKAGDLLYINGPFGSFKLETKDIYSRKHMFIATGTGISPFHCFVSSYPGIDYIILHGTRFRNETYGKEAFDERRYISCVSGEENGKYTGRVTRFLPEFPDTPDTMYYICGNSSMIYEVSDILNNKGVPGYRILTEVYF